MVIGQRDGYANCTRDEGLSKEGLPEKYHIPIQSGQILRRCERCQLFLLSSTTLLSNITTKCISVYP